MAPAVIFHERLSQLFPQVLGAAARPVGVGGGGSNTITGVHGPQLLVSSDSVITPALLRSVLSAQARI